MRATYIGLSLTLCMMSWPGHAIAQCARTVVGRHIFYNNSYYDTASTAGTNPCNTWWAVGQLGSTFGTVCSDNTAVSNNRIALLPGESPIIPTGVTGHGLTATCNYSSYSRGINGIMIDIEYTPDCSALPAGSMTVGDITSTFEFAQTAGMSSATGRAVTSAYTTTRTPASVTIAPHPTLPNTDRVKIIFADNTSANSSWLRTRILPGGVITDLTAFPDGDLDRFYFGLAIAEGLTPVGTNALVNATDQHDSMQDHHTALSRPNIEDRNDFNRDALVDAAGDQSYARPPLTTTAFTCLQLTGTAP